jgi:truncated hemoglobin YjbI
MFKSPIENAIKDQYEFFIQRFGGPPLYSQRKGHPALRARHVRFPITKPAAQRWLEHMRAAVDEVGIKGDTKEKFLEFVTEVAFFLQNIDEEGNRIYG